MKISLKVRQDFLGSGQRRLQNSESNHKSDSRDDETHGDTKFDIGRSVMPQKTEIMLKTPRRVCVRVCVTYVEERLRGSFQAIYQNVFSVCF